MSYNLSHYPSLLSSVNSTTSGLNAGNSYTFTGSYQECSKATYLVLEASCNQPTTFTIRWSEDSAGTTSYEEATVYTNLQTVTGSAYNSIFLVISPVKGKYFRIKANSGSTTVDFFICRMRLWYQGVPVKVGSDGTIGVTTTPSLSTAVFQTEGAMAFGTITTSFQNVITLASGTKFANVRWSYNNVTAVVISLDGGASTHFTLEPRFAAFTIDFGANGLKTSADVRIKYTGSAPTSGNFYISPMS